MNALDDTRLVDFLEAVYSLERSDEEWLTQSLRALHGVCGGDRNYVGVFYDASDVEKLSVWNVCRLQNAVPELSSVWNVFWSIANPTFVRGTFRSLLFGTARKTALGYLDPLLAERERHGHGDFLYLNGLDASGIGCAVAIGSRERELSLTEKECALLERMAAHLGAAYRCRRKIDTGTSARKAPSQRLTEGAEAILDSNGRIVHAEGAARTTAARQQLRTAATWIDFARSESGRRGGMRALHEWHPLTDARWTLLDTFEENGRRYVVARENQSDLPGIDALTDRERQIVGQAALGQSNKEIAYTLGISANTVRVLMARAARRLGVRSRKELLAHSTLRGLEPEPDSKH